MIHFDYLAIAALSSILTAIPLFLMALLIGSNHTSRTRPAPKQEPEPQPEPEEWRPAFLDGFGWDDDDWADDDQAVLS